MLSLLCDLNDKEDILARHWSDRVRKTKLYLERIDYIPLPCMSLALCSHPETKSPEHYLLPQWRCCRGQSLRSWSPGAHQREPFNYSKGILLNWLPETPWKDENSCSHLRAYIWICQHRYGRWGPTPSHSPIQNRQAGKSTRQPWQKNSLQSKPTLLALLEIWRQRWIKWCRWRQTRRWLRSPGWKNSNGNIGICLIVPVAPNVWTKFLHRERLLLFFANVLVGRMWAVSPALVILRCPIFYSMGLLEQERLQLSWLFLGNFLGFLFLLFWLTIQSRADEGACVGAECFWRKRHWCCSREGDLWRVWPSRERSKSSHKPVRDTRRSKDTRVLVPLQKRTN